MSGFKFDPYKPGLRKTLREWEEIALRYLWSIGEVGANSGPIWRHVNEQLGPEESRSRASVIFFMNRLVDQGVLGFRDATEKGRHHKVYYPLRARAAGALPTVDATYTIVIFQGIFHG